VKVRIAVLLKEMTEVSLLEVRTARDFERIIKGFKQRLMRGLAVRMYFKVLRELAI